MDNPKIILVVDDSSANLGLCRGLLKDEYDVRLAKSGRLALDALEKLHPDLILLDIEMPEMSGFDVMTEINKKPELQGVPVIFVTSHATEKLVVKAVQHGAVDYIVKPFEAGLLRTKVQAALKSMQG